MQQLFIDIIQDDKFPFDRSENCNIGAIDILTKNPLLCSIRHVIADYDRNAKEIRKTNIILNDLGQESKE